MKAILLLIVFVFCIEIFADPAPPYNKELKLSDDTWDIISTWQHGKLKILKESIVKIPNWHFYCCKLPILERKEAGVIISFVNANNFWETSWNEEFGQKYITLYRIKDGKKQFSASVPFSNDIISKNSLKLRLEVYYGSFIKIYLNNKLALAYNVQEDKDFPMGRIGLIGDGKDSNISISGIAKR